MVIPEAFNNLRDEPIWVAWDNENGKKVPKSPYGGNAKSNDPTTWGTYSQASELAKKKNYSGVGVMLGDGYIGIDLDGAIEDGELSRWAKDIVDRFDSYTEISPSGTGIHIIAHADLNEVGLIGRANHSQRIEIYNYGRYFTVTGKQIAGSGLADITEKVKPFVDEYFSGESPDEIVCQRIGTIAKDQTKRMANQTMAENCIRDGIRYARVPQGAETCTFCIMLASRSFVYTTPEEAQHSHDGCDCKVMPGFNGIDIEGYDPDALYRKWKRLEDVELYESNLYGLNKKELIDESASIQTNAKDLFRQAKKNKDYFGVYEPFLSKFQGKGSITAQEWANPEGKEIQLASWLATKGHDIEFLTPSSDKGSRTPDFRIDGEVWEAKRIESCNPTKLKARMSEASNQSSSIIVDLSINEGDLDQLVSAAIDMLEDRRIKKIMVVCSGKAEIYKK